MVGLARPRIPLTTIHLTFTINDLERPLDNASLYNI